MAKIKYTKGELKRQRDALEQFEHYLPTLQLKKQQLQIKILEIRKILQEIKEKLAKENNAIDVWANLLGDPNTDISAWVKPKEIVLSAINIAGADLPVFKDIIFLPISYNLYSSPLWYDKAIENIRKMVTLIAQALITQKQLDILERELRVTTQRVNLFEKVKIPECLENIRRIRIYLGDQLASAVGIGKVAKKKLDAKILEGALA